VVSTSAKSKSASKSAKSKSAKSASRKPRKKAVTSKALKATSVNGAPPNAAAAAVAAMTAANQHLPKGADTGNALNTDSQAKKKRRGVTKDEVGDVRERKRLHNAAEKRRQQKISAQIEDLKVTVQTASGQDIPRGRAHVLAATHAFLAKILTTNQQVIAHQSRLEFEVSSLRKQLALLSGASTPTPPPIIGGASNGDIGPKTGAGPTAMDVDDRSISASGTQSHVMDNSVADGGEDMRVFSSRMGRRPQPINVVQLEQHMRGSNIGPAENGASIQMFRRLECSMSTVILEMDRNFNICYASPGSRYFTGEMPRLLIGKNFQNMIHHEDVRRVRPKFRALLQQG
jgi:PAS domain-containing protein